MFGLPSCIKTDELTTQCTSSVSQELFLTSAHSSLDRNITYESSPANQNSFNSRLHALRNIGILVNPL